MRREELVGCTLVGTLGPEFCSMARRVNGWLGGDFYG